MKFENFRAQMIEHRSAIDERARELKDSQSVLEGLFSLYHRFDAQEQAMADRVVAEWVMSEDAGLRFDALALVGEFRILPALTALRELALRLSSQSSPGARHELDKVNRITAKLIEP